MIYRTNSSRAISEAFYAVNNDAINEFYNIDTKPYNVYTEENVFKVIWGGIKAFFRMLRDLFMRFINWIKSLFSKHKATAAADDAKAKEVVKAVAALPAGNSIDVAALPAASLPALPAPSDDFGNIKHPVTDVSNVNSADSVVKIINFVDINAAQASLDILKKFVKYETDMTNELLKDMSINRNSAESNITELINSGMSADEFIEKSFGAMVDDINKEFGINISVDYSVDQIKEEFKKIYGIKYTVGELKLKDIPEYNKRVSNIVFQIDNEVQKLSYLIKTGIDMNERIANDMATMLKNKGYTEDQINETLKTFSTYTSALNQFLTSSAQAATETSNGINDSKSETIDNIYTAIIANNNGNNDNNVSESGNIFANIRFM